MKKDIQAYFGILKGLFDKVIATGKNRDRYKFEQAIEAAVGMIVRQSSSGGKLLFIGNGASAAISSHMATDFWKNAGIKALSFNDSSLLTCVSNDCGYAHVFEKPIEMFAQTGDVLVAISSSGRSENIIKGARLARLKGLKIITLSGFARDNPLRLSGDLNFYVPYSSYGHIELVHQAICHCLVDIILSKRTKGSINKVSNNMKSLSSKSEYRNPKQFSNFQSSNV